MKMNTAKSVGELSGLRIFDVPLFPVRAYGLGTERLMCLGRAVGHLAGDHFNHHVGCLGGSLT